MTVAQLDLALRAFCRRRPFQKFVIEFTNGKETIVRHPEAVRNESGVYAMRTPDGGSMVFAAESVTRLVDLPVTAPPT